MTTIINGSSPSITFSDGSAQTSATRPFLNRIINGAMVIDQRNAGASVSNIGNGAFITDRFFYDRAGLGITAQFTASQSTDAPTGFQYSAKLDTTTAQTLGATGGTYFGITHKIEGFNMANMANNAATLSFWVKATKTGTYSVVFKNSGNDRSYVGEYTVSSSNTWEYKTITISSVTTAGTWNYTNGVGLSIFFCIAVADDVATSTIGSWISSNVFGSVNNVEGADNTANDFLISGVQLEVGSTATSFDYRPYGTELALCQRYYEKSYAVDAAVGTALANGFSNFVASTTGTADISSGITFRVTKRANPTVTAYNAVTGASGTAYRVSDATAITVNSLNYVGPNQVGSLNLASGSINNYLIHWTAAIEL